MSVSEPRFGFGVTITRALSSRSAFLRAEARHGCSGSAAFCWRRWRQLALAGVVAASLPVSEVKCLTWSKEGSRGPQMQERILLVQRHFWRPARKSIRWSASQPRLLETATALARRPRPRQRRARRQARRHVASRRRSGRGQRTPDGRAARGPRRTRSSIRFFRRGRRSAGNHRSHPAVPEQGACAASANPDLVSGRMVKRAAALSNGSSTEQAPKRGRCHPGRYPGGFSAIVPVRYPVDFVGSGGRDLNLRPID